MREVFERNSLSGLCIMLGPSLLKLSFKQKMGVREGMDVCCARLMSPFLRLVLISLLLLTPTLAERAVAGGSAGPRGWDRNKYASIVVDVNNDRILFSRNARRLRYPASLTKMMTLYLLFEEIESGRMRKNTIMSVSQHASKQIPASLGLRPGDTITAHQAIRALVTKSANDVAVVVAEHVSGSERAFAKRMTASARQLGMKQTRFRNASGLHDAKQRSTAYDLSLLARALYRHHPDHYAYFSTVSFSHGSRKYRNHNHLLGTVKGVDGIKTGYTLASGYNLATSLRRGRRHLIVVVMGGPSGTMRNAHVKSLLIRHFRQASIGKTTRHWRRVHSLHQAVAPLPNLRPPVKVAAPALLLPSRVPTPVLFPYPAPPPPTLEPGRRSTRAAQFHLAAAQPAQEQNIDDPTLENTSLPKLNNELFVGKISHKLKKDRWLIQIGAYDYQRIARARLSEALLKGGALRGRQGYTEPVRKGNETLYRARFGGFSKKEARQACRELKKAKFNCLPMPVVKE